MFLIFRIDIPGIPVLLAIFEGLQLISIGEDLAMVGFIPDTGDVSRLNIDFDFQELVFKNKTARS